MALSWQTGELADSWNVLHNSSSATACALQRDIRMHNEHAATFFGFIPTSPNHRSHHDYAVIV